MRNVLNVDSGVLAKIAEVFLKEHFVLTQVYVQFHTYP
jgi:hypothetical protein